MGVSPLAGVFNAGLIAAGICFAPFVLGLGLALRSGWGWAGIVVGLVAAVSLTLVGVFPMNRLQPHALAAITYFRAGLLTVLVFGIAIWRQPRERVVIDRRANWATVLAVAAYAVFLLYVQRFGMRAETLDPTHWPARPDIWLAAVLEWAIFFTTVLWFLVIALSHRTEA